MEWEMEVYPITVSTPAIANISIPPWEYNLYYTMLAHLKYTAKVDTGLGLLGISKSVNCSQFSSKHAYRSHICEQERKSVLLFWTQFTSYIYILAPKSRRKVCSFHIWLQSTFYFLLLKAYYIMRIINSL